METSLVTETSQTLAPAKAGIKPKPWRAVAPLAVMVIIALIPAPAGCAQHAWY